MEQNLYLVFFDVEEDELVGDENGNDGGGYDSEEPGDEELGDNFNDHIQKNPDRGDGY
jgi:hypothetical protein